ncbi:MAG: magnesium transporter CorA family protein [bacterium]|nr:magnesium transporter CorA family protein [bacterium]
MIANYFSSKTVSLVKLDTPKAGSLVYIESPTEKELDYLSSEHGLDIDLLKDGLDPNESPRVEDYDKRTYIYTRYVLPASEKQTTTPVLIVFGVDMLYVIARQPFGDLEKLLDSGDVTTSKRAQTLLQILATVNRSYRKSINTIARRIWRIRSELSKVRVDNKNFIEFIDIEEDLNDFLLALEPMNAQLNHLLTGKSIRLYEDDKDLIEDLELGSHELISLSSSQLTTIRNIRDSYSTIATNNLNSVIRLMTAITIVIGICTMITGIYGMNVALPNDDSSSAFYLIVGLMLAIIVSVFGFLKYKKWL